jgi:hypothetical protein
VADIDVLYLGLHLVITSLDPAPPLRAGAGGAGDDWPGCRRVARGGPPPPLAPEAGPVSPPLEFRSLPAPPAPAADWAASPPAGPNGQAPQKNGLGQLVLTLIKLLHELLERQAMRRMEAGSLSLAEMERLGVTLLRQAREIERMARNLGLAPGDLNLDLGPLGKLL